MSGTIVFIEFNIESQAGEIAAQAMTKAAADKVDVPQGFTFDGFHFNWLPDGGSWYIQYLSIMTGLPSEISRYFENSDNPQFRVTRVRVEKSAAVVDRKAAIQGEYDGTPRRLFRRRQFDNCTAIVDNFVGGGGREVQSIVVYGPPDTFGEYMIAIRARRVRPRRRMEPAWWRVLLGL